MYLYIYILIRFTNNKALQVYGIINIKRQRQQHKAI